MTPAIRQRVYDKYNGKCAYCGCKLSKKWHVDHKDPIYRISEWNKEKGKFVSIGKSRKPDNETIENYNPACISCNIVKHTLTIEGFRNYIMKFLISLNRDSTQYNFAKRYGLVQETGLDVKFYFETFSSHCH